MHHSQPTIGLMHTRLPRSASAKAPTVWPLLIPAPLQGLTLPPLGSGSFCLPICVYRPQMLSSDPLYLPFLCWCCIWGTLPPSPAPGTHCVCPTEDYYRVKNIASLLWSLCEAVSSLPN